MSNERDDEFPPWRDPPPGALEMIRAARETPPMTPEEEDRAVQRALEAAATIEAEARPVHDGGSAGSAPKNSAGSAPEPPPAKRPWWRTGGPPLAAFAMAASIVLWLWVRPEREERQTAKGPPPRSSATAIVRGSHSPIPGTASTGPTGGHEKDAGADGAR